MYPNHGQYYQAPYQPPHGYGHPPQTPHPLPAPTEGAPKKKLSTGAKWAIGIGAFLAFGAIGGLLQDDDEPDTPADETEPSAEPSQTTDPSGADAAEEVDTEPETPAQDDPELDEWTEMVFELTWNGMSAREQDELCTEVEHFGAETSADMITDEIDPDADIDRDTVESILTDYCL